MKLVGVAIVLGACAVKLPSSIVRVSDVAATSAPASAAPGAAASDREDDPAGPAEAAQPAIALDPKPAAFRDADGTLHGPGGPVSSDAGDCGPAQNHCLRANGWFASGFYEGPRVPRRPVFQLDGHWYTWRGEPAKGGSIYRTAPATLENLSQAREVFVFLAERKGAGATAPTGALMSAIPRSEQEALTARRWTRISIYSIDAKAGTFTADDDFTYQIAAARVAFYSSEAR
jgi:hypothetical protein